MKIPLPWDKIQIGRKKLLIWGIIVLIPFFLFTSLFIVQFISLFFLFIIVSARLYTEYLIRNIRVNRMDSELRVFRHEWVRIEIKVENHGLLPAFMLVAGDLPGDLQVVKMRKTFCTLFRHSWTLIGWDGLCADRGVFNIGPAIIRGADPLGLFPFRLTMKETTKLYVYPAIRSINLKNRKGIPLGNIISVNPLFEDITCCRSLRPYYPGDERRRINWKASANFIFARVSGGMQTQSGLLVNEYDATASYPLMVFLNADQNEYPRKKRKVLIERTIEAVAALCLKASRERQAVGIIIYTSCMEGGLSVVAPAFYTLVPILERLAALDWIKPANTAGLAPDNANHICAHNSMITMLNQGKYLSYGTRYLYAGPDLGDEAYITLNLLKKHHLYLEYLVLDERSLFSVVPGNSPRYQMKESGYEII
jgi:uncharacterized protein (DUF58 family)